MRRLPFDYAVRNLGRSPLRLVLTVGGSALLVLVVLAAAAFVRGMDRSLRASGGEHNVVLLGTGSEESIERSEVGANVAGILAASIRGIREEAGVPFVSPEVHVQLPIRMRADVDKGPMIMMRGVTPTAMLVHDNVRITEGRFPAVGRNEILVGSTVNTRLGVADDRMSIGNTLTIDNEEWTIIGRFSAAGSITDAEIWLPLTDLKDTAKRETDSCVVITLDPAQAEFDDVDVFARMRIDLELTALRERDYYSQLASFFAPIRAIVWVTAGLITIGGFLGGLNTLYAAFVSRVREMATLRALGFKRRAVLLSLIQESTLATTAGALIAAGLGLWLLDGLAVRFSMGAFGLIVDAPVIVIALGVGLGLGLFGALPPGTRCLRLSIPAALKAV